MVNAQMMQTVDGIVAEAWRIWWLMVSARVVDSETPQRKQTFSILPTAVSKPMNKLDER